MASQTEKGHYKNLANLKLLTDYLTQLNTGYNPSNNLLSISALNTLVTVCQTDFDNWASKLTIYKDKSDLREIAYEPINKLVTSINASVQQLNEPQQTFNDIQAFVKKIHGDVAKIKISKAAKSIDPNAPPIVEPDPSNLPTDPISNSQQSYDSIEKNFNLLILRLQTIASYTPNETELQIATLQAQHTNIETLNLQAGAATNALDQARNQRNLSYYAPQTGLYDITLKIKKYLKSNQALQAEYSYVTKLKFVKIVQRKKKKA